MKRAQVILEVVMVFVVLAVLVAGAVIIFSNTNINTLVRLKVYKQTRVQAANSLGAVISPLGLLDLYSQNAVDITINPPHPGSYISSWLEPRIDDANLFLERSNDIINFILPAKAYLAKSYLDNYTAADGYQKVSKAKQIVQQMIALTHEAWNRMFSPNPAIGAIAAFQDVLNNPLDNGPFDPDLISADPENPHPEIEQNRSALRDMISASSSARDPLNQLLYQLLLPRLDNDSTVSNPGWPIVIPGGIWLPGGTGQQSCYSCNQNNNPYPIYPTDPTDPYPYPYPPATSTLLQWQIYQGVFQNLNESTGALQCWYWRCRHNYYNPNYCYDASCKGQRIQAAQQKLSEILSSYDANLVVVPVGIVPALQEAYALALSANQQNITRARDICSNLLGGVSSNTFAYTNISRAKDVLSQALSYWNTPSPEGNYYRDYSLRIAREKLKALLEAACVI